MAVHRSQKGSFLGDGIDGPNMSDSNFLAQEDFESLRKSMNGLSGLDIEQADKD